MFERFSREARVAVVLAQEEARELGADRIGTEHLLLGVLLSATPTLVGTLDDYGLTADTVRADLDAGGEPDQSLADDADVLRSIGIDLTAVRESVTRTFGDAAFDDLQRKVPRRRRYGGHIPFARPCKKALELSLREASEHHWRTIESGHVLLGILDSKDAPTLDLITRHVDPAELRTALVDLLDDAA